VNLIQQLHSTEFNKTNNLIVSFPTTNAVSTNLIVIHNLVVKLNWTEHQFMLRREVKGLKIQPNQNPRRTLRSGFIINYPTMAEGGFFRASSEGRSSVGWHGAGGYGMPALAWLKVFNSNAAVTKTKSIINLMDTVKVYMQKNCPYSFFLNPRHTFCR